MIQFYIHMYLFFFKFFSHLCYCRVLSRVPCAVLYSRSLLVIYFILAVPRGMWDLSSLTRDRTCVPCSESWES